MSDLSKYCVHLRIGERGAGSSKRRFPHLKYAVYRAVMAVGLNNSGDFLFCILYYILAINIMSLILCFIPSKPRTIMPKSLTCGYSISVHVTSVVGYHTTPTHY